jgi:hypothetical protein
MVLAIVFGISLGLCGVTFLASSGESSGTGFFMSLGVLELAAMGLSAVGLIVTVVVWVTLAVIASFQEAKPRPQKLIDDQDDTVRNDHK